MGKSVSLSLSPRLNIWHDYQGQPVFIPQLAGEDTNGLLTAVTSHQ